MTLDEFRSKYRLQQRLTQRGVASYHATDSSGRVLMVHSLDSASREEVDHVRSMIHRLDTGERKRILEILDVDGAPVLVTEYLQGFRSLTEWLEMRTRGAPTEPIAPVVQPKGPPRGEFTQLFGPAEQSQTPVLERPAATAPPAAAAPPNPPQAAPKPPSKGGEFTQLFGAISPDATPPKSAGETKPPTAGDFTRLFGAIKDVPGPAPVSATAPTTEPPSPPPPTAPPPPTERPKIVVRWRENTPPEPPPRAAEKPQIRWKEKGTEEAGRGVPPARSAPPVPPPKAPGEFTRLFGAQAGPPTPEDRDAATVEPLLPEPPPEPPPRRSPAQAPRPGGPLPADGFTQILRAAADLPGDPSNPPEVGAPPAVPGPSAKAPGEFTSLMAGLPSAPVAPRGVPQPPAAGPGPSEFTRIIAGIHTPTAPAAAKAAPPPDPASDEEEERQPSLTKLFIALGVVLLLGAALIVFFALKK
jgi:hypothetical protein